MPAGTLVATEQSDAAALNRDMRGFGLGGYGTGPYGTSLTFAVAVTEARDGAAFSGSSAVAGTIAANEAGDASNVQGSTRAVTTLAATEGPDTASLAGSIGTSAVLASTEAKDTAACAGSSSVVGAVAAAEAGDSVSFSIDIRFVGAVLAVEGADSAAFTGSTLADLFVATSETQDVSNLIGFLVPYLHRVDRVNRPDLVTSAHPSTGVLYPVVRPPREQDFTILERRH